VQDALRSIPGVHCAHVDFDAATATVYCTPECDRQALIDAVELRGYGCAVP